MSVPYSPTGDADPRATRSRQGSIQDRSKAPRLSPALNKRPVEYTVIVRLPFPRGNFVDPALVEWDSVKDKALWKIISKESDTRGLDWEEIAKRFDVSLAFLLKQAAWLYERHFAGVRKQMQRLATTSTPSPVPSIKTQDIAESKVGSGSTTATLARTGSKSSQHAPRAAPTDSGSGTRSIAPQISRTPSTATITQSRAFVSARQTQSRPLRTSGGPSRVPPSPRQRELSPPDDSDDEHVDDSDSDPAPSMARSQAFRRPPLASKPTLGGLSSEGDVDDDEDDEDESSSAGFLPFAAGVRHDPSATLRGEPVRTSPSKSKQKREMVSSTSSGSSTHPPQSSESGSRDLLSGPRPGPLSPKHRAQLKQLSPRGSNKDGSDGTPSMGSSFSDLDDAGISASALEDAVLSNMQAGGGSIASRVSGLSQAFRSQR